MIATTPLREVLATRSQLPSPSARRALREAAGVSQEAIARELGVSRQAISNWESGRRYPRADKLSAYVDVLRLLREASA